MICGDNIQVVSGWPDNCIDSIVTDPPYGLGFMGKEWDTFKQENVDKPKSTKLTYKTDYVDGVPVKRKKPEIVTRDSRARRAGSYDFSRNHEFQQWFTIWAKAMLRITRPGGFLLCFGGTRTFHRLTCAIEDAGWEIRDCMMWLYGSGFPKSHDISKAIQKAKGIKPEKIEPASGVGFMKPDSEDWHVTKHKLTMPKAEGLAQFWNGYGTALKPAWEPIIVAMKPKEGSFADNAEKYGVAGLNIDGGRIGIELITQHGRKETWSQSMSGKNYEQKSGTNPHQGRWPANLILDEEARKMLDEQSGKTPSNFRKNKGDGNGVGMFGVSGGNTQGHKDFGGASRFFYCAKTSRKERNMGLEDCEDKVGGGMAGTRDQTLLTGSGNIRNNKMKNNHPTVKPLALMKYLCTLLKMPGYNQVILDPFMGSGTTAMACKELGINYIGIEKEKEYCEIARKRIAAITY